MCLAPLLHGGRPDPSRRRVPSTTPRGHRTGGGLCQHRAGFLMAPSSSPPCSPMDCLRWRPPAFRRCPRASIRPTSSSTSSRVRVLMSRWLKLREQIFDVAIAEREADIEVNRVPDHSSTLPGRADCDHDALLRTRRRKAPHPGDEGCGARFRARGRRAPAPPAISEDGSAMTQRQ